MAFIRSTGRVWGGGEGATKSTPSHPSASPAPGMLQSGPGKGVLTLNRVVFDCVRILEHVGSGIPHTADLETLLLQRKGTPRTSAASARI